MDTGVETWKIRLEKFQLSFYTSVYIDENAKQELLFDLLQVNDFIVSNCMRNLSVINKGNKIMYKMKSMYHVLSCNLLLIE